MKRSTTIFLIGVLIVLPLPRHWSLIQNQFPGVSDNLTNLNLYLSDVFVLVLLVTSVPYLYWRPHRTAPRYLVRPLVGLVVLTAVSSLWAFDVVLVWQQTLSLLLMLALFFVLVQLRPEPYLIQIGVAASLFLQGAIALIQFVRQNDFGLRWLGELDLMTSTGGDSILFAEGRYWLRGYGLTPHPNILGGVLALFILALIIPYLQARSRYRPVWLVLILLGLAGLFITFSRAAWLGGLLGGLSFLAGILLKREWREKYGRSLLILLFFGGVLSGGLGWQQRHLLLSRVSPTNNSLENRAVNERIVLAQAGLTLFRLAPLTGIGAGNTAVTLIPLVAGIPKAGPQPIHNVPFLMAIELGLPGTVIWIWLMIFPVVLAWQRWRQNQLTLWALALTSALVAFAVIDLFDYYAWSWQQGRLLRWLFLGLWASAIDVKPFKTIFL